MDDQEVPDPGQGQGAVLLTVGRSYVGNDDTLNDVIR